MPIDYKKYPPNWKTEIRPRILERDGHECKFCGIKNYTVVRVHPFSIGGLPLADVVDKPPFTELKKAMGQDANFTIEDKEASRFLLAQMKQGLDFKMGGFKYFRVVLTIAHIHNPNPMDCRDENLAALCQKCHNALDAPMRKRNSKTTREAKKKALNGQIDLF